MHSESPLAVVISSTHIVIIKLNMHRRQETKVSLWTHAFEWGGGWIISSHECWIYKGFDYFNYLLEPLRCSEQSYVISADQLRCGLVYLSVNPYCTTGNERSLMSEVLWMDGSAACSCLKPTSKQTPNKQQDCRTLSPLTTGIALLIWLPWLLDNHRAHFRFGWAAHWKLRYWSIIWRRECFLDTPDVIGLFFFSLLSFQSSDLFYSDIPHCKRCRISLEGGMQPTCTHTITAEHVGKYFLFLSSLLLDLVLYLQSDVMWQHLTANK